MKTENMKTPNVPAKNHPWRNAGYGGEKLKEARRIRNIRRTLEWRKDNMDLVRANQRKYDRSKRGVPIGLPIMKPWDFKKGKVAE